MVIFILPWLSYYLYITIKLITKVVGERERERGRQRREREWGRERDEGARDGKRPKGAKGQYADPADIYIVFP